MIPSRIYSDEPAHGWLPFGVLAPFLAVVFVAAPLLTVSFLLEYFQLVDAKGDPIGLAGLYAFLLFPFAMIGLVVLVWVRLVEKRSLASIGLSGSDRGRKFFNGVLIGISTILAVVVTIWIAGGVDSVGYGTAIKSPEVLLKLGLLLICFGLQSSVEELIFRGSLLSVLARKFNIALAVVITSIVFTFLHYSPDQPWLVTLSSCLFSVFACSWALNAGSIWGVMGWHAGWNWLLGVGFELPVTGLDVNLPALIVKLTPQGPDYLNGGTQGPEGSFFCSVFFVLATLFIVWRSGGKGAMGVKEHASHIT